MRFGVRQFFILHFTFYILFFSCSGKRENVVANFGTSDTIPLLNTSKVSTLISDSGVVRYRITADEWVIYKVKQDVFWDFSKGLHVERFDRQLNPDANIQSDRAFFFDTQKLWRFSGNVQATNLNGEKFESNLIFWNQREARIYSDAFIRITQQDKIITGIGFESNQSLTNYTIHNPQGIFPIREDSIAQ
jgi:LPS export ABC transporter protein LptC